MVASSQPSEYGWKREDGIWIPLWITIPEVGKCTKELLKCSCKGNCSSCSCGRLGLDCKLLCQCNCLKWEEENHFCDEAAALPFMSCSCLLKFADLIKFLIASENKADSHKSRALSNQQPTNQWTDGPTNRVAYRVACTQLKKIKRLDAKTWRHVSMILGLHPAQ